MGNDILHVHDGMITVTFSRFGQSEYELFLLTKQLPEYDLDYDWETDSYTIKTSSRFAYVFGMDDTYKSKDWLPISDHLFDFQKFTTKIALEAKRYACWWLTGMGKTHLQWELARQTVHRTNGKALLIVPLNIIHQTLEIGSKYFDLPTVTNLSSREKLREWCASTGTGIGVVNPEKFIPPKGEPEAISEVKRCACVLLDEASLLASAVS